jgi:hypothetical protein
MATTNSDYTENKIVDHVNGKTAWTMPAAVSMALFTTNPNFETGAGGTEASGGSYARKAVAFTAAAAGADSNTGALAAGTYTGWGVYDAATVGNMLYGDAFAANRVVSTTGDTITFAIGAVTYSTT